MLNQDLAANAASPTFLFCELIGHLLVVVFRAGFVVRVSFVPAYNAHNVTLGASCCLLCPVDFPHPFTTVGLTAIKTFVKRDSETLVALEVEDAHGNC